MTVWKVGNFAKFIEREFTGFYSNIPSTCVVEGEWWYRWPCKCFDAMPKLMEGKRKQDSVKSWYRRRSFRLNTRTDRLRSTQLGPPPIVTQTGLVIKSEKSSVNCGPRTRNGITVICEMYCELLSRKETVFELIANNFYIVLNYIVGEFVSEMYGMGYGLSNATSLMLSINCSLHFYSG